MSFVVLAYCAVKFKQRISEKRKQLPPILFHFLMYFYKLNSHVKFKKKLYGEVNYVHLKA